ncbi:MAG: ribonuclease P protein component [Oscillospiraceae bacterium]|jgi:ribonuclease P protein component|nr:ribonuclease P protein component [Oscillospiraceae bacterium]
MKAALSLKNNYEFRRLYSKGRHTATPLIAVYCLRNRRGVNRCGITAGTKFGNAVCRNRFRRRIRELYRLHLPEMNVGWDIVTVARSRAKEASYREIEADFLSALISLGVISK